MPENRSNESEMKDQTKINNESRMKDQTEIRDKNETAMKMRRR